MARISSFYGVGIWMYHREHGAPHFHVRYGGEKASVAIIDGKLLSGSLPPRVLARVRKWARLHRAGLMENWERARLRRELKSIPPMP